MTRVNLIVNPSFRNGTQNWEGINGATLSEESGAGFYGDNFLRVVKDSVTNSGVQTVEPISVVGGQPYAISAYVRLENKLPLPEAANIVAKVQWFNSIGVGVGESTTGVLDVDQYSTWERVSGVFIAPATATVARVTIGQLAEGAALQEFFLDAVLLEQSSYVGGYIDNFSLAEKTHIVNQALTPAVPPLVDGAELKADITINDLVLNTIDENNVVWVCTGLDGWWGQSSPDVPDIERGTEDGSYDVSGRYKSRVITLRGVFFPPSEEYLSKALDRLVTATNLVRKGAWLRTNEEPTKAAFVRLSGKPQIETVNKKGKTEFSIGLRAADPVKYGWNDSDNDGLTSVEIPADTGVGVVSNVGTADVTGVFELEGPISAGSTIYNSLSNETITLLPPLRGRGPIASVISKSIFAGVATLETEAKHEVVVGDTIDVSGVGDPYDTVTDTGKVIAVTTTFPYSISYVRSTPFTEITNYRTQNTNLITNPSVETTESGWVGSSATAARSTLWASQGITSLRVTPSSSAVDTYIAFGGGTGGMRNGMVAGKTYTVSADLNVPSALSGSSHARARKIVVFYASVAGTYTTVESAAGPQGSSRLSVTFTLPPNTIEAFIRFYNGYSNVAENAVHWDGFLLNEGTNSSYFDGSSSSIGDLYYRWTGLDHVSSSEEQIAVRTAVGNTEVTGATGLIGLHNNDVLEIDTYNRSVSFNGETIGHRPRVETLIDWIKLAPGNNPIAVSDAKTPFTVHTKGLSGNLVTLLTHNPHYFLPGEQVRVNLPETAALSRKSLTSNVVTLTTAAPHGFSVGDKIDVETTEVSTVTFKSRASNVATLTTLVDGGFAVGDTIVVALPTIRKIIQKSVTSNVATFRTELNHGYSTGDTVSIALPTLAPIASKALTANQATITTTTQHKFSVGDTITVNLPTVANVINKATAGNSVVLTANAPHGFSVGDSITVSLPTTRTVTSTQTTDGATDMATISTTTPHGYAVGDRILVDNGIPSVSPIFEVNASATTCVIATRIDHNWTGTANASSSTRTAADLTYTNIVTDPHAVGGSNTATIGLRDRWAGGSGAVATHTAVSGATDGPLPYITTYRRKTWTTAPPSVTSTGDTGFGISGGNTAVTVAAGDVIRFGAFIRASINRIVQMKVQKYIAGAANGSSILAYLPMTPNQWGWFEATYTVPSDGTDSVALIADNTHTGVAGYTADNWAVGSTLDITGLLILQGTATYANPNVQFFSGATPNLGSTSPYAVGEQILVTTGDPRFDGNAVILSKAGNYGLRYLRDGAVQTRKPVTGTVENLTVGGGYNGMKVVEATPSTTSLSYYVGFDAVSSSNTTAGVNPNVRNISNEFINGTYTIDAVPSPTQLSYTRS